MTDTLVDLFTAQAMRTPDAEALIWDAAGGRMSYSVLQRRAEALAARLRGRGVGPGECVALRLTRGPDAFVATLGVMMAGAACVPLDPSWPEARLTRMLDDCAAPVLITQRTLPPLASTVARLHIDDDDAPPFPRPQDAPTTAISRTRVEADDLAYVIYTSGSTGQPKGVAMVHRALVALVRWQNERSPLALTATKGNGLRTAAFSSFSFDVSFQEMFTTWASGGTLVIVDEPVRRDPRGLLRLLNRMGVHRLYLPYVALRQLAEAAGDGCDLPTTLRDVITAGEQLKITPRIADLFRRLPSCRLHNHYGPSETHVVTAFTLPREVDAWPPLPPIGSPLPSARIYLLDTAGNDVEDGEVGELHVAGPCLARGYLKRPDLTAERFLPEPRTPSPGGRMYRTGDLARRLPDGTYAYLGRSDDQVKIRGYRVEPAEVEAVLSRHPEVLDCAVMARQDAGDERVLVAYVVRSNGAAATAGDLRSYLAMRVADFMVPSAFVFMDTFPQTPTGKVDRRALPPPSAHGARDTVAVAARTGLEREVVRMWEEVLGRSPIGVTDRYAELGGTSLLFVRILRRLETALGREIAVGEAFAHDTPEALARHLSATGTGSEGLTPVLASAMRRGERARRHASERE